VAVPKDATLDAFATQESPEESSGSDDADDSAGADADVREAVTDSGATDSEGPSGESADPVAVTSSWADASTCPDCGEAVPRLWRDGDERACADCKTWHTSGEGACDR
jgi:hypothetical protein